MRFEISKGCSPSGALARQVVLLTLSEISNLKFEISRGCSSAGRAHGLQPWGQGFESPHLHQVDPFKLSKSPFMLETGSRSLFRVIMLRRRFLQY
jgi:hypothetical protein